MEQLSADDLVLFSVIAEQGSLVRAAERLDLPKATVSRRLANLEAGLSQKLLVRTTRRLSLTPYGREFLEHCQRVAEESSAAMDFVRSRESKPSGRLRVSMPGEYGLLFPLSQAIATFIERYPEIQLELDISARRVDLIGEHYDLAIRMGTLEDSATLVARKIWELHFGLYASPIYLALHAPPSVPDELMRHSAVRLTSAGGKVLPWKLASGRQNWEGVPPGKVALNSLGMIHQLVLDGTGIGALPVHAAEGDVRAGRLARVLPGWSLPVSPAWAVMPGRRYFPLKTAAFLAHIEACLKEGISAPPRR